MRCLFLGDVVGQPGMTALKQMLKQLTQSLKPDLVIANGENAHVSGKGITREIVHSFYQMGIDVITLGNHAWDQKEIFDFLDRETRIVRPANYPEGTPGVGYVLIERDNRTIAVCNLMGRSFLPPLDCPFRKADELIDKLRPKTSHIIVDFHAEASAEKIAMAWHLDGRVSAIVGTHTHVQTADERILPNGTAFISDVGMVGAYDGVIGIDRDVVRTKFLTQLPVRFQVQTGRWQLNAVLIDLNKDTGQAESIRRIRIDDDHPWMD
ncbi:TIGR00282 family metallophosphoesterase [Numidum massiliense]|uniref:TIGR00282 family metallophosphoesterase n=1 Tax=Numidum massiliense TaxID=1522315 RepID=UPI0006D54296|nr:TIGR00282 family metallophosphoesterase [Numidum massiliense]